MKIKTLGIFDSGLGGYSVYHDLITYGPNIEYVLYADQKNAPYGNQTPEAIYRHAQRAMQWFKDKDIDHVLLACNTVSAVALEELKKNFPDMTIWGIIDLTLSQIKNKNAKIDVVSTQATFQSHAYKKTWTQGDNLLEHPLPHLVTMIEGNCEIKAMDEYLKTELRKFSSRDFLVLACTHFPLVYDLFTKHFSGDIVDSRKPIRNLVNEIAGTNDEVSKIYTSGDEEILKTQIKNLFNVDEKVRRI